MGRNPGATGAEGFGPPDRIPSDLEETTYRRLLETYKTGLLRGTAKAISYRLERGMTPPGASSNTCSSFSTLADSGVLPGVKRGMIRRKFVIDFKVQLCGTNAENVVEANVNIVGGRLQDSAAEIDGPRSLWRLGS